MSRAFHSQKAARRGADSPSFGRFWNKKQENSRFIAVPPQKDIPAAGSPFLDARRRYSTTIRPAVHGQTRNFTKS